MDRQAILDALRRLGALARDREIRLEISIYGGSAMLLAYDSRAATKDVEEIQKVVDDFYPDDAIPDADRVLLESLIRETERR